MPPAGFEPAHPPPESHQGAPLTSLFSVHRRLDQPKYRWWLVAAVGPRRTFCGLLADSLRTALADAIPHSATSIPCSSRSLTPPRSPRHDHPTRRVRRTGSGSHHVDSGAPLHVRLDHPPSTSRILLGRTWRPWLHRSGRDRGPLPYLPRPEPRPMPIRVPGTLRKLTAAPANRRLTGEDRTEPLPPMDVPPSIRGRADRPAGGLGRCSSISAATTISTAGCRALAVVVSKAAPGCTTPP